MNILLWILQILLAMHAVIGAVWKFSNSEQVVPSLQAIPHAVWLGLSVFEFLCALFLVLPVFKKSLGHLIPLAASGIAAEMLLFCGVSFYSGTANSKELIYWLVVAASCTFIAYGRKSLRPIN